MLVHRLTRSRLAILSSAVALAASVALAGCAAMDPQGAAQQQAPTYYGEQYGSLNADQKMRLEDHLAGQSNQAWRTTAQLASGVGRLTQGVGVLLFSARH